MTRHALYFMPADGSPLACFGQGVLGRDALGGAVAPLEDMPPVPDAWTRRPARYGFHATLKAPFHLVDGSSEPALIEACDALADAHAPIRLSGLAPARLGTFLALVLPAPLEPLERLAADCVTGLEPFRAPLDAGALARRRPERLDPAARARLERWGYPHVFDGFRFHMTLSAALPGARAEAAAGAGGEAASAPVAEDGEIEHMDGDSAERAARWLAALRERFARTVGDAAQLDRLALCREATVDAPFVRIAEFPLEG